MVARKELLQCDEVTQRLTHLLSVDGDHIVMHPVLHGRMPHRSLGLGYLTLMMGEHQIHATTVDIKLLTEILPAHGCTLAVPPWETVAPR